MTINGRTVISSPECPDFTPLPLTLFQRIQRFLGIMVIPHQQRVYILMVKENTIICSPSSYADLAKRAGI